MEIFEKRGKWCFIEEDESRGIRKLHKFGTEEEAKLEAGWVPPADCGCWDCKCEPCECDKVLDDVEDVEPVKVKPKTDWNLKNEKRGSDKQG